MHRDVVLISVPYTIIEVPPLGLAVLKGVLQHEGFSCKTYDLGYELYDSCNKDRDFFDKLQEYAATAICTQDSNIETFFNEFIDKWAHIILEHTPHWVGISVFSYYSHVASLLLTQKLKQLNPEVKIVIGGSGASTKIADSIINAFNISVFEKMLSYGDILKQRKLVDECIYGDGEQPIVDLFKGTIKQVDSNFYMEPYREQQYPYADFDDLDIWRYPGQVPGHPQIPIFTSKGCVRKCDFCDVGTVQDKFRFRNGKNIVNEMIYLSNRYKINEFLFVDSLANGSLKSLKEWVSVLADYNQKNPNNKITWSASGWICRRIGSMPVDYYPLMARSGCEHLAIGVESGSNRVLKAIDKKTDVEALYFEIDQLQKNNIKFMFMLIMGHWSEHWEDFLETADLMYNVVKYVKSGHLTAVSPANGLVVIPDTPMDRDREKNKLVTLNKYQWWSGLNPSLTAKERYYRVFLFERFMDALKIPNMVNDTALTMYNRVSSEYENIKSFYESVTKDLDERPEQYAKYYFEHFDEFLNLMVQRNENLETFNLRLTLESSTIDSDNLPGIQILFNDREIFNSTLAEGIHNLEFLDLKLNDSNKIKINFYGKGLTDTQVDENGNIIKDKFIQFKEFYINDFDIFFDQEFFYNKLDYYINDEKYFRVLPGFWANNASLEVNFTNPITLWFCQSSDTFKKHNVKFLSSTSINTGKDRDRYTLNQETMQLLDLMNY